MLSADAKEQLDLHVGDNITINTPAGDFIYTVSGFCADDTQYNADMDSICAYINSGAVDEICSANDEEDKPVYYIQFQKGP